MTANGYGISLGVDRNVLELDTGDGCTFCEYSTASETLKDDFYDM